MHLVLLPGLGGSAELFDPLIRCAPEGFSCSVVGDAVDRCSGYAGMAAVVLEQLDADLPFVLVGESFSGPVAILAAARNPKGLAGIVLCNSFVVPPAWRGWRHLPWNWLMSLPVSRLAAGYFLVGFDRADEWLGPIRRSHRSVAPRVLAHRLRSTLEVDVRRELESVEVPVMYLRGTSDRLVGPGSLETVVACRATTRVERLDGPHLLLQTRPGRSWRAIVDFVAAECAS